jgi:hypothetical protein
VSPGAVFALPGVAEFLGQAENRKFKKDFYQKLDRYESKRIG